MKQITTCLSFSFLIDCSISVFFSVLIKAFANFQKLTRFHWQAFIVYKNGANLKMLIEIFCQKPIVANVISAFLDHLKPWWMTQSANLFQNLLIRPRSCIYGLCQKWQGCRNMLPQFISIMIQKSPRKNTKTIKILKYM